MGRIMVKLKLVNQSDLVAKKLKILRGKPRELEVEALVDTGATRLYLKSSVVKKLGLRKDGTTVSHTTNGRCRRTVYEPVRLELMGRHGNFDVVGIDDSVPNLMGQIPLEYLDFVADSKGQKLTPNPEHHGQWMTEEY